MSYWVMLLTLLLPSVASAVLSPGDYNRTIDFGGLTRDYRLRIPTGYDGSVAMPLVVDIHGLGQTSLQQRVGSGYAALANSEGFIGVWPAGYDCDDTCTSSWNNGDYGLGQARVLDLDDVGLIKAIVRAVAGEANVNPARLYATGISAGGGMAQRLGCDAEDYFAAIAPLAHPFPYFLTADCPLVSRMPTHLSMGLTDQVVDYSKAIPTLNDWRDQNACAGSTPDESIPHGASSTCDSYLNCAEGAKVTLCSVVGQAANQGHWLYINDDSVDLALEGWTFLSQFTHTSPPNLYESKLSGVMLRGGTLR